jgi:hypothetical protein
MVFSGFLIFSFFFLVSGLFFPFGWPLSLVPSNDIHCTTT